MLWILHLSGIDGMRPYLVFDGVGFGLGPGDDMLYLEMGYGLPLMRRRLKGLKLYLLNTHWL